MYRREEESQRTATPATAETSGEQHRTERSVGGGAIASASPGERCRWWSSNCFGGWAGHEYEYF